MMAAILCVVGLLHLLHLGAAQLTCTAVLTESIPDGMVYAAGSFIGSPTYKEWSNLINRTQSNLTLSVFYFTLTGDDIGPNLNNFSTLGASILKQLAQKGKLVSIVQNVLSSQSSGNDTAVLAQAGATIHNLNMSSAANLSGVLHTKMWVSDLRDFYVGSANMDWRSLTQVKELGITFYDCPQLSTDAYRLYAVYEYLAQGNKLPSLWPDQFTALTNESNPLTMSLVNRDNPSESSVVDIYLTSSPPPFCSQFRTNDLDSLVRTILSANRFVYLSVMDYFPLIEYQWPVRYWPVIDDALRKVVVEKPHVGVCLLASKWNHTRYDYLSYLRSLNAFAGANRYGNITVKQFIVPTDAQQAKIPFARVNHNKYIVTEQVAFVSTSNYVGNYYIDTAGVSLLVKNTNGSRNWLREKLEAVFVRDWNSIYTYSLTETEHQHQSVPMRYHNLGDQRNRLRHL